jgi:hypothetical protein
VGGIARANRGFELVYTRGKRERKKKEIALLSKTWKRKAKEEFRHPNVPKGERERGEGSVIRRYPECFH